MNDVQLRIAGLRKQAGLSQGAVRTGGEVGRNDDVHFRILVKDVIAKQKAPASLQDQVALLDIPGVGTQCGFTPGSRVGLTILRTAKKQAGI